MTTAFIPAEFEVPIRFEGPGFHLEPLGAEHNERDHEAWMSSIDHIRSTPGFGPSGDWPAPMGLDRNLDDLVKHAWDFEDRQGFTYSVLDGDEVIGCLYIYPSPFPDHDASVRSWVRKSRSEMDVVVWRAVSGWLGSAWPFENPDYATRANDLQR